LILVLVCEISNIITLSVVPVFLLLYSIHFGVMYLNVFIPSPIGCMIKKPCILSNED
jgi:hypothetical protein